MDQTYASDIPTIPAEAYTTMLAGLNNAIKSAPFLTGFQARLEAQLSAKDITTSTARAKYLALLLTTSKAEAADLQAQIKAAKASTDVKVIFDAVGAIQELANLGDVMTALEMLLCREVLSLES